MYKLLFIILLSEVCSANWAQSLIRAQEAFKILQPKRIVKVAVIDTGVDINHEKIKSSIWFNSKEKLNGIDDDGNGFVDDVNGWNFHDNNNRVQDNHGHGTHVTGIILNQNISKHIQIIPIKYIEPSSLSGDTLASSLKAFEYAINLDVDIINYSAGGGVYSEEEKTLMQKAEKKGILIVAAAGNEGENADQVKYYPAGYNLGNIISVTAVNEKRKLISVANYGMQSVHIAAPGFRIYSALPYNKYGVMTGTSQATAYVTGVAAMILSQTERIRDASLLKERLLKTTDVNSDLNILSQGILDARSAITQKGQGLNANNSYIQNANLDALLLSDSKIEEFATRTLSSP